MTQYTLFGGEPPSQRHSETSRAAATAIKERIGPMHARILASLSATPFGWTDEEMQRLLLMSANTQRPRRRELELMGRIMDSGKRRPTASGRQAVVWVASK